MCFERRVVNANVPSINKNIDVVFEKADAFENMLDKVFKLTKNLDVTNRVRNVNNNLQKLVTLLISPKFDVKTLKSFCHLSASIYLVSIHLLVNRTLCGDPKFLRSSVKMNKKSDGKLRKWANTKGSIKSWCKRVKLVQRKKSKCWRSYTVIVVGRERKRHRRGKRRG